MRPVLLPSEYKPTWPGLETPTSIDHAIFLRSRARYIRDTFREDMRDCRYLYLLNLEAI